MLPKGILFDLDDTIIAFSACAEPTWRRVCAHGVRRLPGVSSEQLYDAIRVVRRSFWDDPERHRLGRLDLDRTRRRNVERALGDLGVPDVAVAHEIADAFSSQREEAIEVFPGARDALAYFAAHGVRLALVTNGESDKQRAKIERYGLAPFFHAILIEEEQGLGKPDDRVYARALECLGLSGPEVWAVGDNLEWDVAGPQRFGAFGIWNDHRREGLPHGSAIVPDRIVHSIVELVPGDR